MHGLRLCWGAGMVFGVGDGQLPRLPLPQHPQYQPLPSQPNACTHPNRNSLHLLSIYHRSSYLFPHPELSAPQENYNLALGTLDHLNQHETTATFLDMTAQITNNNRFRFPTNTTDTSNAISFPIKPPNPPDTTSFPYTFTNSLFNPTFLQFTLDLNIPPPNPDHLHDWGCHDLRQALIQYPTATACYTDGSDDPKNDKPCGSAATFNTSPPVSICNISPIKGSYPAEIFAIVFTTLFQALPTLSQPIIFAIDSLSVCSTLHFIQQATFNPFTASNNPFCLWYSHSELSSTHPPSTCFLRGSKAMQTFLEMTTLTPYLNGPPTTSLTPQDHISQAPPILSITSPLHYLAKYPLKLSSIYSLHTPTTTYRSL